MHQQISNYYETNKPKPHFIALYDVWPANRSGFSYSFGARYWHIGRDGYGRQEQHTFQPLWEVIFFLPTFQATEVKSLLLIFYL